MKKLNSSDFLRRINLSDVIQVTHPQNFVSKRGKSRCPLHEDKNPSFSIKSIDGIDRFKCFAGCGAGDVTEFLKLSGLSSNIKESFRWLLANNFLEKDFLESEDEENYLLNSINREIEIQETYEKLNTFIKDNILSSSEESQRIRDYFFKRGIDDVETLISKFDVGFWDSEKALAYGFSKKELKTLGLWENKTFKIDKGICFIYHKTFGEYSGFKIRSLNAKKFIWFGKKNNDMGFFGLNSYAGVNLQDSRNNDILLVEGEFDVLVPQFKALSFYGDVFGIVCRSGGAISSPNAFRYLKEHGISSVAVFPDSDQGGREFVEKCSKLATANNMCVDVIWPASYETQKDLDPADITKDLNANEVKSLLVSSRKPISRYLAEVSNEEYIKNKSYISDQSNLRIKTITYFVEQANNFGLSDLMRDEYARELEGLVNDANVTFNVLRRELDQKTSKGSCIKIGNHLYSIGKRGYEQWVSTDKTEGTGFYTRVSNFIINFDRLVKFSDKDEYEIVGHIAIEGKKSSNQFIVSSKDLITSENFFHLVRNRHPVGIEGLLNIKAILPELVSQSNRDTPVYAGVDRVGYYKDSRVYITPSIIIEEGQFLENKEYNVPKADVTVNTFFRAIDYSLKSLSTFDLKESRDLVISFYLNCLSRKNSLMSLGHAYSSVLTPYFSRKIPPHALFFRGLAGSFKSTFAQITMGLFYKNPFNIKWLHARDTTYSVEMALSYVNNAPMILDDIKPERQNAEDIMMIVQSLYDEQGRSRLNKDLSIRQGRSVANQGLILTGEVIPTSQLSILSRMIQLDFKRSEADIDKFEYLKDHIDILRRLTPFFIKWLQVTYEGQTLDLYEIKDLSDKKYRLERTYYQVRKTLTGLNLFLEFLVEDTQLSKLAKDSIIKEAETYSKELLKANITKITHSSKESELLEEIGGLIRTKLFSIWGPQQGSVEVGVTDNEGNIILNIPQLKIGISKHSSMRDKIKLINQIINDLEYQGKCQKLDSKNVSFKKEVLLGKEIEDYKGVFS